MAFEIIFTNTFSRKFKPLAKKYPSIIKEIEILYKQLQEQPTLGTPIGKSFYKIRLAISSKNSGKSGGARVITYVLIRKEKVYLTSIYDKSAQEDITASELENILKQIPDSERRL